MALGPVLLGIVNAHAIVRRRRLSPAQKIRQEEAVKRPYDKPESDRETMLKQR